MNGPIDHTCQLAPVGKYSTISAKCRACQDPQDPIVRLRADLEVARAVCEAGLALQEAKRNPNRRLAKPAREQEVARRRDERDRALASYKRSRAEFEVKLPDGVAKIPSVHTERRRKKLVAIALSASLKLGQQAVNISFYSRSRGRVWGISKILPSDPTMIAMGYARRQVLDQAWRELRAAWRARA